MMRPSALLLPLLAALPVAAQQQIDRRFAVDADVSLRITNMAGITRVIGWDRDSVVVTGTLAPRATFFGGGGGRFAKMGVDRADESLAEPGSTLEVHVPRAARIFVRSGSANVEASGLTGEFECSSVAGSIRLEGALRIVTAETMDGAIEMTGGMEITRLKGGSGVVTLRRPRGDVLVSTVGGAIVAIDAQLDRADLRTISGAISYDGFVRPHGTLEATTHSGNLTLQLPASVGVELQVVSFEGAIETDLVPKAKVPKGATGGNPWSFTLGDGAARIRMESFKGTIRILRK